MHGKGMVLYLAYQAISVEVGTVHTMHQGRLSTFAAALAGKKRHA